MNSYIFLCNDHTEPECLERNLFGGTVGYLSKTKNLSKGMPLFLYNYQSKKLHGIFEATSEPQLNIIEKAWNRDYPWQVKVKRTSVNNPLTKSEINDLLGFNSRGFPSAKLNDEKTESLIKRFEKEGRMSIIEKSYEEENPATKITEDGHYVRSLAEVAIDNWLFSHGILHGYEKKLPISELLMCDFFIPIPNSKEYIYIEYWGKEDKSYQRRKAQKLRIYKKYNLHLIELTAKDLKNLDKTLGEKLAPYFFVTIPFTG